jgi:hypothetical protein
MRLRRRHIRIGHLRLRLRRLLGGLLGLRFGGPTLGFARLENLLFQIGTTLGDFLGSAGLSQGLIGLVVILRMAHCHIRKVVSGKTHETCNPVIDLPMASSFE